jgi:hypothetical protein
MTERKERKLKGIRIGLTVCLLHLLAVPIAVGAELPLRCDFTRSYDPVTNEYISFHDSYEFLLMKYGTIVEIISLPDGVCDNVTSYQAIPPKLVVTCTAMAPKRLRHVIELNLETGEIYDHRNEIGRDNYRIKYGTCG